MCIYTYEYRYSFTYTLHVYLCQCRHESISYIITTYFFHLEIKVIVRMTCRFMPALRAERISIRKYYTGVYYLSYVLFGCVHM